MITAKQWLAERTPEGIKNAIYRKPIGEIRKIKSLGLDGYFLMDKWSKNMEKAVETLPPLEFAGPGLEVWYLTGNKFWYQTVFCAWSLAKYSKRNIALRLVDDGTLKEWQINQMQQIFSEVIVYNASGCDATMEKYLPINKFPLLRNLRSVYPHIRKLTDVHIGTVGKKMVLDSDMLFFEHPKILIDWIESKCGASPIFMTDVMDSYGYPRAVLEELTGAPLPDCVNVGVCGLQSESLDWDEIEHWCSQLHLRYGRSYFLEQALVAMIAARYSGLRLHRSEYIVWPKPQQITDRIGVLQHYVADSKKIYFKSAWKKVISNE